MCSYQYSQQFHGVKKIDPNIQTLFIFACLLTVSIFIADTLTPLGIAWGFLYSIVVLVTLWIPQKSSTIGFAITGILLTVTGFYLSPPGVLLHIAITNRSLSVTSILVTMFGILKYKDKENIIKEQGEELEKLAEELKSSNSDLEQFAYVASHDLQEPLRKIQSFGERIVSTEKDKLSATGQDYISRMMNASSRMQVLINDLLSYSRLSTRNEPFVKVDLTHIVKDVMTDLEIAIEKNKVKIDLQNLPEIYADKIQMRQLFQNLISNAIKFRKENADPEILITSRMIPPLSSTHKTYTEITIQDNGIGFNEKYAEKMFQFFQRLEGKKYEGTGIGLAVCKKIVIRHGGFITAKSKEGEGSSFIVTLPIGNGL